MSVYEVMMNDYEVCTIWATTADAHVRAAKARDVARGLATRSSTDSRPSIPSPDGAVPGMIRDTP